MDIKRILASTKTYVFLLILAAALLLYTAGVGYKQVERLYSSGEKVTHTLDVQRAIVELSANFLLLESIQLKAQIQQDHENLGDMVIIEIDQGLERLQALTKDNDSQQERVKVLKALRNDMISELPVTPILDSTEVANKQPQLDRLERISKIVNKAQVIKKNMLSEENYLMVSRREEFTSQSFLTPLSSLLVAITSMIIFVIGFISIYSQKREITKVNSHIIEQNKKLQETETFLKGVYKSSNNVISHFEPIKDDQGKVIDFKFVYASNAIEEVTGSDQAENIGKTLVEMYPMVVENGLLDLMKHCYNTGEAQEHESEYVFADNTKTICNTIVKSGGGITNTAWDTTNIKKTEKALYELNEELSLQNTIFKEAEIVAGIGSYIWYLDDGSVTISDNFYRLLGYEPNSFPITLENYRNMVHPDDREDYDTLCAETIENGTSSISTLRIITKDKKVLHLNINGRLIQIENQPVSVGIVQDITEQVKKDNQLIDSYDKLKLSNEELESFSRVASHDLQEPLRKIQVFISRIEDDARESLPKKSVVYFEKIKIAALRMRDLIQNLLTYSGIERQDGEFEEVNLNGVVSKVTDELSQLIKETNAQISNGPLPKVKGVAFKLEQVFANLISNSIKYRKNDVDPIITISSTQVNAQEIQEKFSKNFTAYHRIALADNGIGFAPEYAKTIFEVFQKLHSKTEYSGTGIGLSICKKIVENHQGHIHAVSTLGEGATFVVYLPVH
ncbi:PAS domain S-box-containing protein [Maribacter sedimenticola]|uniref:histidine kinase n=1 Tax=Maribacter sedimenticola TaxID=228956 RepID=A0ABY1SLA4_9FLAO|nr:ATP-binding protein [Maribacter sedimenticola]SNR74741.1 PAS domain S-box-containing protein [Maribacter sedimenticola]